MLQNKNITSIYMTLLDEGTPTIRPVDAEILGENIYRVLPSKEDLVDERGIPIDEEWQFLPGAKVRCQKTYNDWLKKDILVAYEQIED